MSPPDVASVPAACAGVGAMGAGAMNATNKPAAIGLLQDIEATLVRFDRFEHHGRVHEYFLLERHFDRMTAMAAALGDELVNAVPDLPGANSAYQIVVHCCGMLEWWSRTAILGLDVDRDRDAEFEARGTVAEMLARVGAVRTRFVADLARIDPASALKG